MSNPPFVHRFRALGSDNEIQLHAESEEHAARLTHIGVAEANRIEAKYSRYLDASLTSKISRAAGGDWVDIDVETAGLLDYADACYRQSEGMFDLTSGVLRQVWNFRQARVPDSGAVAALLPLIGWEMVEREATRVRLPRTGMELDFGDIGKEYCADRVATAMVEAGARHGLVNL